MKTKRTYLNLLTIASILLSALAWSAAATGTATAEPLGIILYVKQDAPGAGTCSAWADPCGLQAALSAAVAGDEIWVAAGTYYPGLVTDPRSATFQLKKNVALYGGFGGTETSRAQRDPSAHPTTLSGDIDRNGTLDNGNSYHVVTGSGTDASAIMDGFTITAGNANASYPYDRGGGMYNSNGSPTLTDVTFSGNSAAYGGGMANWTSISPTLTHVTFSANTAFEGGGMYNNASNPTLTDVTFSANSSSHGGGMYNLASSPILTEVTFSANTAFVGGGMANYGSSPTLTEVTFSANTATGGGGMYNSNGSPTLIDVTFSGNTATSGDGGGMFNSASSPTLTNVTFSGNSASNGGGMFNTESSPTQSSSPTLTNVTFSANSAASGGGMASWFSCNPTLINSILWGNTPMDSQIFGGATITYSDIQGLAPGLGNIDADPLFVEAASGNLRLLPGSPAIDAGENDAVPPGITTDLDGSPRFVDYKNTGTATVDMGAYEARIAPATIYVDADAPASSQDGTSWGQAFKSLQSALSAATRTHEIWVAAGTYYPNSTGLADPREATFQLQSNVALYGGFAGTETSRAQRDPSAHPTLLSGDLDRNGTLDNGNSYHVVTGSGTYASAVLDGFTISAGVANASGPYDRGGGMYNNAGSPTLTDVTFRGNTATQGGGMYNEGSSPTLTNVTFSGNSATSTALYFGGGGMYNNSSSPTLTDVTFSGNTADEGGGMRNYISSPMLINVSIIGNSARWGAGMSNRQSSPTLINGLIRGNAAPNGGGGIHNYNSSSPTLINVTLEGNSANNGGGMDCWDACNPTLTNTILWGNTATVAGPQIYNPGSGTLAVNYSLVEGGCPIGVTCDDHLLSADPRFVNAAAGNLRLQHTSPAIDAGNNAAVPVAITTDLDGSQRSVNIPGTGTAAVDMGAYETQLSSPVIYVNRDSAGPLRDGTSWATALTSLQSALAAANGNNEIWVAAGTYYPGPAGNRLATFQLKNHVALYGGFAGTENSRDQRDPAALPTTLSGDIDHNGTRDDGNAYHVLTGSGTEASAVLDGFTISAGVANGADPHNWGGGMYNNAGSPTLTHVTFSGNSAISGGGMLNQSSSPALTDVTFSANTATYGGGLYNWISSSPTLTDVTFSANTATDGGGMYNNGSSPTLTNVTFSGNSAPNGGGMFNNGSSPTLTNVTFSGNSAWDGGGMANYSSSPTLTDVTFSANSAFDNGGGMYNADNSNPTLTDVTFSANSATEVFSRGGGMANYSSSPTLTDVTFSANTARFYGGGMYNDGSSPILTEVTFSANTAATDGGGMFNNWSSPTLTNVTFSGNSAPNGGGMFNNWSSPTLTDVTFSANSATSGGGIYNDGSSPTLTEVTFSANTAATDGGGLFNNVSNPTMTDVTFSANSAASGGGMFNDGSNPTLIDVTFSANSATSGGGMYNGYNSNPTLTDVTFSANGAGEGGGMYNNEASPTLTNVTFSANTANEGSGGGMANWTSSSPTLTNVTFSANSAADGGGMFNDGTSSPTLINSIVWGNTPMNSQISGSATITYSDIQGGWSGEGNIDTDPLLGPLADNGGFTQTHDLRLGSPAIDAGSPTVCPATDQRGAARPIDGDWKDGARCDMGAVEFVPKVFFLPLVRR